MKADGQERPSRSHPQQADLLASLLAELLPARAGKHAHADEMAFEATRVSHNMRHTQIARTSHIKRHPAGSETHSRHGQVRCPRQWQDCLSGQLSQLSSLKEQGASVFQAVDRRQDWCLLIDSAITPSKQSVAGGQSLEAERQAVVKSSCRFLFTRRADRVGEGG